MELVIGWMICRWQYLVWFSSSLRDDVVVETALEARQPIYRRMSSLAKILFSKSISLTFTNGPFCHAGVEFRGKSGRRGVRVHGPDFLYLAKPVGAEALFSVELEGIWGLFCSEKPEGTESRPAFERSCLASVGNTPVL